MRSTAKPASSTFFKHKICQLAGQYLASLQNVYRSCSTRERFAGTSPFMAEAPILHNPRLVTTPFSMP